MFLLAGFHVGHEVEIEAVTHPVARSFECGACGGCSPVRRAGADANDMHDATRATGKIEEGLRRPGDGAGAVRRAGFLDDEI